MTGTVRGVAGRRSARAAAVVGAMCAAMLLTSCSSRAAVVDAPSAAGSSAVPSAPGSAGDAGLRRFTAVVAVVAKQHSAGGMDFVRALERAGYRRSALQVTADRTAVGLAVPAVQFAALDDGSCLIGQYGDAGLQVLRAEPVDGSCLIGETRPLG